MVVLALEEIDDAGNKIRAAIPDMTGRIRHESGVFNDLRNDLLIQRRLVVRINRRNELILEAIGNQNERPPSDVHRPNRPPAEPPLFPLELEQLLNRPMVLKKTDSRYVEFPDLLVRVRH